MSLAVGSTIGILGGGQLGQMLAVAAGRLGYRTAFLEPDPLAPAASFSRQIQAAFDDEDAIFQLESLAQVITLEFENVPAPTLEGLERPLRPAAAICRLASDRRLEKKALEQAGLPVAPYRVLDPQDDDLVLQRALSELGSGLLKTATLGYDGHGQARVSDLAELREALGRQGPSVLEQAAPFTRELSVQVARNPSGQVALSGVIENLHEGGILRRSHYPPQASPQVQERARELARRLANAWSLEGLLTLELFELPDGSLLVNELAPRVHNSGHLSLDGGGFSQFEIQIRAVCDLPLLDFAPEREVFMINLLGWPSPEQEPDLAALLRLPGTHLHLYGKRWRPLRKLGHVNVTGPQAAEIAAEVSALLR